MLNTLDIKTKPVRKFRNKLIAHSDLSTKLNTRIAPLQPVFFVDLKMIISMIEQIMNTFEASFSVDITMFDFMTHNNEADYLYEIFKTHLEIPKN